MTSQTEKLRQEFEAWAKNYFREPNFELDPDFDFYISFEIDIAWKAWQAAKNSERQRDELTEALRELVEAGEDVWDFNRPCLQEGRNALAKLDSEPAVPMWIPCSERLPTSDDDDYQLYCEDTDEQFVGYQIEEGRFCYANKAGGLAFVCKPSHWMPLPEPPQGARE